MHQQDEMRQMGIPKSVSTRSYPVMWSSRQAQDSRINQNLFRRGLATLIRTQSTTFNRKFKQQLMECEEEARSTRRPIEISIRHARTFVKFLSEVSS